MIIERIFKKYEEGNAYFMFWIHHEGSSTWEWITPDNRVSPTLVQDMCKSIGIEGFLTAEEEKKIQDGAENFCLNARKFPATRQGIKKGTARVLGFLKLIKKDIIKVYEDKKLSEWIETEKSWKI